MLTLGVAVSGRWLWPLSRYGPLVDPMRDMQKSWKQIVVFRITYDASKECIYFTHSAFGDFLYVQGGDEASRGDISSFGYLLKANW